MNKQEIEYALSKQVPNMEYKVSLHSDYGDISLYGNDAKKVAATVRKILEKKLNRIRRDGI